MKKFAYRIVALSAFCLLMVSLSTPSSANGVASDVLTIFSSTGEIIGQTVAVEGTERGGLFGFRVLGSYQVDMSQFFSPTILLESPGVISDVIGIGVFTDGTFLAFLSDSETTPVDSSFLTVPGARIFMESQQTVWDVSYLLDPAQGYRATFSSDTEVPEPSTMLLLGTGFLSLVGLRRKFKN